MPEKLQTLKQIVLKQECFYYRTRMNKDIEYKNVK